MEQDLSKLDVTQLHSLSPEVICNQATINIAIIGHEAEDKLALVKAICGVEVMANDKSTVAKARSGTVGFPNQLERNIAIKPRYVNAKIYKCEDDRCPRPLCYKAYGSGKENPMCDVPGFEHCTMKLLSHVSFVDYPGHEILAATALNGAATVDGALLLIAADKRCPQPETAGHIAALGIMDVKDVIILQNHVDVVEAEVANENRAAIEELIKGTVAEGAPVVPVPEQLNQNIDVVCEYVVRKIPVPQRNFIHPPHMIVIRSIDGVEVDEKQGGVLVGSILKGVLKLNQSIEIRPGIVTTDAAGNITCTAIHTRIVSLFAEQNELQFAVPGGLISVGTTMNPSLACDDRLVGQVVGVAGSLPDVFAEIEVKFFLLRRLIGVRSKKQGRVKKLDRGELLLLNIGSMSTGARVLTVRRDLVRLQLTPPVCTSNAEKVALSRRVDGRWRLIGWGQIQAGTTLQVQEASTF